MAERPQDIAELYLAPVAMQVDGQIDSLSGLGQDELARRIAAGSDRPDWLPEIRADAVLPTVGHLVDPHAWSLAWDERGIRLEHGHRSLVLGVPANVRQYIAADGRDQR